MKLISTAMKFVTYNVKGMLGNMQKHSF